MPEWSDNLANGVCRPARRMLIGGNWKCNGTNTEISKIVSDLNDAGKFPESSEVVIAVPSIHINKVQNMIRGDVAIASEDCGLNGNGAYTGEISAAILKDAGVKWTLTGHSERRVGFGGPGESSEVVAGKAAMALAEGLSVIICIGEKLSDRESGKTLDVLIKQLIPVIAAVNEDQWAKIVVAYEPLWAIGTGKVATPEVAQETHAQIRDYIASKVSPYVAKAVRIIYGGSVNAKNCSSLIVCPEIDGFLVGGASLKPEFADIIKCTASVE